MCAGGQPAAAAADATTVRVRDGEVLVTDGPFAETKEQIAGFDLLECDDLDEAIEVAVQHPRPGSGRSRSAVRGMTEPGRRAAIAAAFREEWGRIVATLIRLDRRLGPGRGVRPGGLRARAGRWPRDGVPAAPGPG